VEKLNREHRIVLFEQYDSNGVNALKKKTTFRLFFLARFKICQTLSVYCFNSLFPARPHQLIISCQIPSAHYCMPAPKQPTVACQSAQLIIASQPSQLIVQEWQAAGNLSLIRQEFFRDFKILKYFEK